MKQALASTYAGSTLIRPNSHILLIVAGIGIDQRLLQLSIDLLGGGADGQNPGPGDGRLGSGRPPGDAAGGGTK